MPSRHVSKAKAKPVLKAPTFKYGGSSYVVLTYAKMKKAPFTVENILGFTSKMSSARDVGRAVEVLLKNDSIKKVTVDSWIVTPTGIQQIYDFAARRAVFAQTGVHKGVMRY